MIKRKRKIGIYLVTDSNLTRKTVVDDVKCAIEGGIKIVQYREKKKSKKKMIYEAKKISKLCKQNDVIFLINDYVDLALESDADGVHIGQEDTSYEEARNLLGRDKIIGITVHNIREAKIAQKKGADYLGVSPVFDTSTKEDAGKGMGISGLKKIVESVNIPCVAIGGINRENISDVFSTGVSGAAMVSAILCNDDVEKAVKELMKENIFIQ